MAIRQPARLLLALLTLALATMTLGGTATAAPVSARPGVASPAPYPPVAGTSSATPDRLSLGDCTDFTGDGFATTSTVSLTDNGATSGSVVSDASGVFHQRRCFDAGTPCGAHELGAAGHHPDGSALSDSALVTMVCLVQKAPGESNTLGAIPGTPGLGRNWPLYALVIVPAAALLGLLGHGFTARWRSRPESS